MANGKRRRSQQGRGRVQPAAPAPAPDARSRFAAVLAYLKEHAKALGVGSTGLLAIAAFIDVPLGWWEACAQKPATQQITGDGNTLAMPGSTIVQGIDAEELARLLTAGAEGLTRPLIERLQAQDAEIAGLREQLRELTESGLAQAARSDPGRARELLEQAARGDASLVEAILKDLAAREDAQTDASRRRKAEVLFQLAALAFDDHPRESLQAIEQGLALDPGAAPAWKLHAELLLRLGRAREAAESFERVIELARASSDRALEADGYRGLGFARKDLDDLQGAERTLRRAIELDRQLGNVARIAIGYTGLGLVYRRLERYDDAQQAYLDALAINERLGHLGNVATNYLNLGAVYGIANEPDQAESYLTRALAIFEKIGDRDGQAQSKGNLGKVYLMRGELDAAEKVLLEALAIAKTLGLTRELAIGHASLGELYERKGEPHAAREHYEHAQRLYGELGDSKRLDSTGRRLAALAR